MNDISYIAWLGNILLFVGIFLVGEKQRKAFVFTTIGEALWAIAAYQRGTFDLLVLAVVFCLMQAWNWVKWGKNA